MVYNNSNRFCYFAENAGQILYNSHKAVLYMNRIKDLRLERNMKQSDLADLLNCTAMTVSRYERGEADPDVATICKLCDIFGCTADFLLCRAALAAPDLTPEEETLLLSWRAADAHARAIVDLTLSPFKKESSASATA